MRIRTAALASALIAGFGATAGAFAPVSKGERPVETASSTRPIRQFRTITRTPPASATAALDRARAAGLGRVLWDDDLGTASQLWGAGIAAPGANANPAIAEAAARAVLADHLAVLAPGATVSDFVLISNVDRDGLRGVGFAQRAGGVPVLGGQIGFVFEHDRLVIVNSTALPNVAATPTTRSFKADVFRGGAARWVGDATGFTASASTVGDQVVLPIVHSRTATGPDIEYRVVTPVRVALTDGVGTWDVYVDAETALPLARRSVLRFSQGTITYNVWDRNPQGTKSPYPAANATHTVNGAPANANANGVVSWTGAAAATVSPGLKGPLVQIHNSGGALVTTSLSLAANGTAMWDETAERSDAQLDSYIYASIVKAYVKTRIAPNLTWLDGKIDVYVNESGNCNAYSNGDDIHFFPADAQCENTGRIADVVYHEFGHSVHNNAIIPGVGSFAGDVSEGMSDSLAATITNDSGMGRGFFFDNSPLRELDPVGIEKKYPDDVSGEPHNDGEIIAEAMWDLRKALIAALGHDAGVTLDEKIWYHILEVSVDMPSSYAAALAADDDDGNLANGTPNQCKIQGAFGLHGLADLGPQGGNGIGLPEPDGLKITVPVMAPANTTDCPPPTIMSGTLVWKIRGGTDNGSLDLVKTDLGAGNAEWSATLPAQADGTVVNYRVNLVIDDGSTITYPNNPADPDYELYLGQIEKIWCDDFENGAGMWTHGATAGGDDEWEAGAPQGLADDPATAYAGTGVFGIDLTGDGFYSPDTSQWAKSPAIDVTGHDGVRLQYRRWLGVEDGFFDTGSISINGAQRWSNFNSDNGNSSNVAHRDREWRFQDLDLAAEAATGTVQIQFGLDSDPGLEFGGWTLDDVCIVARLPGGICGDGTTAGTEECDDHNTTDGDGCSATCTLEGTGDDAGDDTGTQPGGCCSTGTDPGGPMLLGLMTIGALARRRRRK